MAKAARPRNTVPSVSLPSMQETLRTLQHRVAELTRDLDAMARLVDAANAGPASAAPAITPTEPARTATRAATTAQYVLRGPRGANARAVYRDGGLLVLRGSELAGTVVPSMPSALRSARDQLINGQVVARKGRGLLFTQDHFFPSVSTAAAVVMGRNANGWSAWRDERGRPLARVRR